MTVGIASVGLVWGVGHMVAADECGDLCQISFLLYSSHNLHFH